MFKVYLIKKIQPALFIYNTDEGKSAYEPSSSVLPIASKIPNSPNYIQKSQLMIDLGKETILTKSYPVIEY